MTPTPVNNEVTDQKLVEQISAEMTQAADNVIWEKPASDIITRIESMEGAKSVRAIWEMVQNARDVARDGGADIEFSLNDKEFIFQHNGLPFSPKSLHSLNIQTSSKVRNDVKQVGRYGTGFLTTHKFGLKFDLSGSLALSNGTKFLDFDRLTFDRSPRNNGDMVTNLKKQYDDICGMCNEKMMMDHPRVFTIFRYHQEYDIERKRASEALEQAPDLTPYVLALNEHVNSISFKNEITGEESLFTRNPKETLEENDLYTFSVVETHIHRNYDDVSLPYREYDYQVYMLESVQREEITGQSLVTVILPLLKNIKDGQERISAFQFRPNKPNFFIHLPLLGTESWGVNFIFHSPAFTCADESRSCLRFVGNGQNNDNQAEQNREILGLAEQMIFSFIQRHLDSIDDRKMFSFVSIDTRNTDPEKAKYLKEKKDSWIEEIKHLPLVRSASPDATYTEPENVCVLCKEMVDEGNKNPEFLDAVYNILMTKYSTKLPEKGELLFWSERMIDWYGDDTSSAIFFSVKEIVDLIAGMKNITTPEKEDILKFDQFLATHNHLSYFDDHAIIPNEAGVLKKKSELLNPVCFCGTAREVMSVIIPDDYAMFVDKDFSKFMQFNEFTEDDFKKKLNNAISELQDSKKDIRDKFRRYTVSKDYGDYVQHPEIAYIPKDKITAMIKYASMVIKSDSVSSEAKILELVKEFYGFSESVTDTLQAYDARSAIRAIIGDAMYRYSVEPIEDKTSCIKNAVETVYAYSDYRSMLRDYKIYLDQNGHYRYAEQIKKEIGVPEGLKDFYDSIVLEGLKKSIKDSLLDKRYESVFVGEGECKGAELSAKIFETISTKREDEDKSYPDISSYKHRNEVMEIIRKMDNTEEGHKWSALFSTLEKDKAIVTMSIISDEEKKDSIFTIIQEDDSTKLKALATITENVKDAYALQEMAEIAEFTDNGELSSILAIVRALNEERKEAERQFNFKYTIGKIIEDELRRAISDGIMCDCQVEDEQDGQDIIIRYMGKPIFYLECKAKWNFSDPARMSSRQVKKAVREKDRYALCCVDCTPDTGAKIPANATREEVMSRHDEIIGHTYILSNIGDVLSTAVNPLIKEEDSDDGSESRIHVKGDLRTDIPKNVFINGTPFREFLCILQSKVNAIVSETK